MFRGKKVRFLSGMSTLFFVIAVSLLGIFSIKAFDNITANIKEAFKKNTAADGFSINSFNLVLDVGEDGVIEVHEDIEVHFYEGGHHGIYRFIPEYLKYTDKNGKTKSRKSVITNLRCENRYYTVDTVKRKKRIKMGSQYETLDIGDYLYKIDYTYDMGKDPYNGFDEFIFHAFGDYWGTPIKNATVTINFPKLISESNPIHFFTDKKRQEDITSKLDYEINKNTLTISVPPNYKLWQSLTVDIELPEGYFVGGHDNYEIKSFILLLICIAYTGLVYLLWRSFGKDLPKEPETVEFYPPYGFDASQIGYINKGVGKKLAIALIVELAAKGYIDIIDTHRKDKIKVKKAKEPKRDISEMSLNEKLVYNKLFEDGDIIKLKEHKTFYKIYSKIYENVRNELQDRMIDIVSYRIKFWSCFFYVWVVIIWFVTYMAEKLDPKFSVLYFLTYICVVIAGILVWNMHRMTPFGETVTAKVNGFKHYLELAEKDRIEMLAEENPNYFFDILPYAYVLGVSKKWIGKFDIPDGDEYLYVGRMDTIYDAMSYTDGTSTGSSSSGGTSSCGGGCSSCGGGCSSCGGGGSW